MYSSLPHFVLGFHGCDRKVGEAILSGTTPQAKSINTYDWLGHGYYFWENNPERAIRYAEDMKRNPKQTKGKIKEPFVVGAVIDLGHCLNLIESKSLQVLKSAYTLLEEVAAISGRPLPVNKPASGKPLLRNLDCAVIETLHQYRKKSGMEAFDSVRGMFAEGKELYPGAGFQEQSHIQICVCNPNCIKGYFRVRNSDETYPIP
jgi:hypothetical protein